MNQNSQSPSNGFAIASLILSILSVAIGPLGFIPGIICGHVALTKNKIRSQQSGNGLAVAGLIIGYVFLGFSILCVIYWFSLRSV